MSTLIENEQDFEDGLFYAKFYVEQYGFDAAWVHAENMKESCFKDGFVAGLKEC